MVDQIIQGTLDIQGPGQAQPFNVLTANAATFGVESNAKNSYFITCSDIGAEPPNGLVQFFVRGDGVLFPRGGILFGDGSMQHTAQAAGPQGPQGPPGSRGPAGPAGFTLPSHVFIQYDSSGGGFISTTGPAGQQTCHISGVPGLPNSGIVAVTNGNGLADASMSVDADGNGVIQAAIKNFRIAHPVNPEEDIVYACLEGPEAAAYVRGTARLVAGQCEILLPEHFEHIVAQRGLTVQLVPLSAASMGLAAIEKSPSKIKVAELHSGSGDYEFDWEVKGVRKAHESYKVIRPRSERAMPFAQSARAEGSHVAADRLA